MIDNILGQFATMGGGSPEVLREAMIADHPLKHQVEPARVADAMLFLASDASRYLNATKIHVDGGHTANRVIAV